MSKIKRKLGRFNIEIAAFERRESVVFWMWTLSNMCRLFLVWTFFSDVAFRPVEKSVICGEWPAVDRRDLIIHSVLVVYTASARRANEIYGVHTIRCDHFIVGYLFCGTIILLCDFFNGIVFLLGMEEYGRDRCVRLQLRNKWRFYQKKFDHRCWLFDFIFKKKWWFID